MRQQKRPDFLLVFLPFLASLSSMLSTARRDAPLIGADQLGHRMQIGRRSWVSDEDLASLGFGSGSAPSQGRGSATMIQLCVSAIGAGSGTQGCRH